MLTGMLLIAKFLILKLFMSSDVYHDRDNTKHGIIFEKIGAQPNNLKLMASVIYHLGLRAFVNETVELKTKDF